MPPARRLSSSNKAAFAAFCNKNQPLSRRLSSNGDTASISSKSRRDSIAQDRRHRPLKRHKQYHNPSKPRPSASQEAQVNYSSPEPKKRPSSTDKENDGDANGSLLMSPTPYWKVSRFANYTRQSIPIQCVLFYSILFFALNMHIFLSIHTKTEGCQGTW